MWRFFSPPPQGGRSSTCGPPVGNQLVSNSAYQLVNATEPVMTDSDQSAHSIVQNDETAPPADSHLPHVEAPGLSPDRPEADEVATVEPAGPANAAMAGPAGTALVLVQSQPKTEAAEAAADRASPSWLSLGSLAAMLAAAAMLGGLAGALGAAGLQALTEQPSSTPPYYAAVAEALGRLDREVTQLKGGIDSAKTSDVARITERLDRAEKAQVEAGTKLARASEGLDRLERRFGAPSNDITGSIADPRSSAGGVAISGDGRRVASAGAGAASVGGVGGAPLPILEGWVVRDIYRGAALIQGRAGLLQVMPGEVLPGLGRIESVQRHDGRWEVVTTRGLIVSR
jgi:hypothetical protein